MIANHITVGGDRKAEAEYLKRHGVDILAGRWLHYFLSIQANFLVHNEPSRLNMRTANIPGPHLVASVEFGFNPVFSMAAYSKLA